MPDVVQVLAIGDAADGNKTPVNVRGAYTIAAFVEGSGGTSANVAFEVTNDPDGVVGWTSAAFRQPGGATYATTAVSVTPSSPKSMFFDPADAPSWIRAVVSGQTGPTTLTGYIQMVR